MIDEFLNASRESETDAREPWPSRSRRMLKLRSEVGALEHAPPRLAASATQAIGSPPEGNNFVGTRAPCRLSGLLGLPLAEALV